MQDDDISKILEDEIVVAMGCTEPAAAALAGAKAGEVLGEDVLSAEVFVSRDMMKMPWESRFQIRLPMVLNLR